MMKNRGKTGHSARKHGANVRHVPSNHLASAALTGIGLHRRKLRSNVLLRNGLLRNGLHKSDPHKNDQHKDVAASGPRSGLQATGLLKNLSATISVLELTRLPKHHDQDPLRRLASGKNLRPESLFRHGEFLHPTILKGTCLPKWRMRKSKSRTPSHSKVLRRTPKRTKMVAPAAVVVGVVDADGRLNRPCRAALNRTRT